MADWTRVGLQAPPGNLTLLDCVNQLQVLRVGTSIVDADRQVLISSASWIARNGPDSSRDMLVECLSTGTDNDSAPFRIARDIILAHLNYGRDRYQETLELANHGRMLALSCGQELEVSICSGLAGSACQRLGQYASARVHYEESVVAARRSGVPAREATALADLALCLKNQGEMRAAESHLQAAISIYERESLFEQVARCELNLALVMIRVSQFDRAEILLRSALKVLEINESPGFATSARIALGRVLRLAGQPTAALDVLELALKSSIAASSLRQQVLAREFIGDALSDLGRLSDALEQHEEALRSARLLGEMTDLIVESTRRVADSLNRSGARDGRCLGLAEESVHLARLQGDVYEVVNSLEVLARIHLELKNVEVASEMLHEAMDLALATGNRFDYGRCAVVLAKVARASGMDEEAQSLTLEARRHLRSMKDGGWLEEPGILGTDVAKPSPNVNRARHETAQPSPIPKLMTGLAPLRSALSTCLKLAAHNINILVLGESGTGKELVAQAIHKESARTGPFVPVNCSAFPGDLLEGELFGHARGAYTGADKERSGLIEYAHRGTLFLDEIGDMPLKAQARLLRALESGEVRRLGENTSRVVDVRVVAATHRELLQMVSAGEFRLDLYYRLAGYVLKLPPVRERDGDARLLVDHFLHEICAEQDKQVGLSDDVKRQLAAYSWPGNVREIRNVVHRLVSMSEHGRVVRTLPFDLDGAPRATSLPEALEAEEKKRIIDALRASNWNKTRAAAALGASRTTLIGKMRRLGIEAPSKEEKTR